MRNRPAVDASPEALAAIDSVLDRFGAGALRLAASSNVRVVHLRAREAYRDRSRALRRLASGVDDWPVPPAGLFVVEERTVYLRSTSPMTVAHEFAHARVIFSSTLCQVCQPHQSAHAGRAVRCGRHTFGRIVCGDHEEWTPRPDFYSFPTLQPLQSRAELRRRASA